MEHVNLKKPNNKTYLFAPPCISSFFGMNLFIQTIELMCEDAASDTYNDNTRA